MIIAIIGDTHFGYNRYEEDSYRQGEAALRSAINRADLILLAGDIFHHKSPGIDTLVRVTSIFNKLPKLSKNIKIRVVDNHNETCSSNESEESGCTIHPYYPIAAIHGTHERRGKGATPVRLLEKIGFFVDIDGKVAVFEKTENNKTERVAVSGLGGVPEQFAKDAIRAMDPKPMENAFNIFMLHQSLKELLYDPTNSFMSIDDLPKGFQLYVNGHIHKPIALENEIRLLIPGSTVLTQLRKEEQNKKGYWLFDTNSGRYEFIEIDSRPFICKEIHVVDAGLEEVEGLIRKEIESIVSKQLNKKPIARIIVSGTLKKGLFPSDIKIGQDKNLYDLQIDTKELNPEEFHKNVEHLRQLKENDFSVRDLGVEILSKKLKEAGIDVDIRSVFDLLIEDPDKFYKRVIANKIDIKTIKQKTGTDISDST